MQPLIAQALAPAEIRTQNLLIRSQMLYPVELRVRTGWEGYFRGHESQGRVKGVQGVAGVQVEEPESRSQQLVRDRTRSVHLVIYLCWVSLNPVSTVLERDAILSRLQRFSLFFGQT